MNHALANDLQVGRRVFVKGSCGVIKYVGHVEGSSGNWYGIDWDDETRGKHNGTHGGIQYFTTKCPLSGSFLRPSAVTPPIEFYEAVKAKYGAKDSEEVENLTKDLYVAGETDQMEVQLIGMQSINSQQGMLDKLKVVSLDSMAVDRVADRCPFQLGEVVEVDLSNNLFNRFDDIRTVIDQLPHLEILILSGNQFSEKPGEQTTVSYDKVNGLYLNNMTLTWGEVKLFTNLFSHLVELQVIRNHIYEIPQSTMDGFIFLEKLSLQHNKIRSWHDVNSLGGLPNLKELILDRCGLKDVIYDDTRTSPVSFPALEHISLSRNKLTDLAALNNLSYFPRLKRIQLLGNAFVSDIALVAPPILPQATPTQPPSNQPLPLDDASVFNFTVSKCCRLERMNKTELTTKCRREAEVFYVNRYGQAYLRAINSPGDIAITKFVNRHPSWDRLIKIHGTPIQGELTEKKFTLINDSLIDVEIYYDNVRYQKKIPVTLTIIKLRNLVNSLIKQTLYKATLTYTSTEMKGIHFDLDDDHKDIGYYCMEDGDIIHVK